MPLSGHAPHAETITFRPAGNMYVSDTQATDGRTDAFFVSSSQKLFLCLVYWQKNYRAWGGGV